MDPRHLLRTSTGRAVAIAVGLLVLGVAAGLAILWPRGDANVRQTQPITGLGTAEVVSVTAGGCESYAGPGCRVARIELQSGPDEGRRSFVTMPGGQATPALSSGDRIRVVRNAPSEVGQGQAPRLDDPSAQAFSFIDFERRLPLLWLAVAFGALVVVLGRLHGVRALLGLGISLAIVIEFIVPAMLHGRPTLPVALIGSLAAMLVTMLLSHGLGLKSAAAMLGTASALILTVLLAMGAVEIAHITGLSSEEATYVQLTADRRLSIEGLVIAGIVIGTLGVLDDVTISQSSTVLALRRANPRLPFVRLFNEGLSVGRDHLTAAVNTLVLAYAGAALPLLLIFSTDQIPFDEAVNRELVAEQIVAMLVGSTGLIAAVPLTTALAALLVSRLPPAVLPEEEHVH
jgi:uncharacterized membrane protein